MENECIHGLGDPDWCTLCNGRTLREEELAKKVLYKFKAQYESKCRCGNTIQIGDKISKMGDESYSCEECA